MLPGFESVAYPRDVRPGSVDMTDGATFTAGALFRDYPEVFKSVATMLFKYGDSERKIAEVLRVSCNTVRAIRDMVAAGASADPSTAAAAAFFIKSRAANAKRTIALRALETIGDRLDDEDERKKIGIDTLLTIVKVASDEPGENGAAKSGTNGTPGEIIDVDEFDDILNGLDAAEKKPADLDGETGRETAPDTPAKADEEHGQDGARSFALRDNAQCLRGSNANLCNSLCNPDGGAKVSGDSPPCDAPAPPDGFRPTGGGGGGPRAARGGVTLNALS